MKLLLAGAALVLALGGGKMLYQHFVTDQIADRGGMENPNRIAISPDRNATLTYVSYSQYGGMTAQSNYWYEVQVADGSAFLSCSAWTEEGALELKDMPIEAAALEKLNEELLDMELLEYLKTESEIQAMDMEVRRLVLEWSDGTQGAPDNAKNLVLQFFRELTGAME